MSLHTIRAQAYSCDSVTRYADNAFMKVAIVPLVLCTRMVSHAALYREQNGPRACPELMAPHDKRNLELG